MSYSQQEITSPVFRSVPGFENYQVDDQGGVWLNLGGSRQRLKPSTDKDGYKRIRLWQPGRKDKTFAVHRMVLEAFVGPMPEGMQVAHWDNDPANNALTNLRYATPSENAQDKKRHGTALVGERHPLARLTEDKVIRIRQLLASGARRKDLAEEYGVSPCTIADIATGRKWKHILTGEPK